MKTVHNSSAPCENNRTIYYSMSKCFVLDERQHGGVNKRVTQPLSRAKCGDYATCSWCTLQQKLDVVLNR